MSSSRPSSSKNQSFNKTPSTTRASFDSAISRNTSNTTSSKSSNHTASSSKLASSTTTGPTNTSKNGITTVNGKTSCLGSLIARKVAFSKRLTSTLILYFLLVYHGIKDAYLVDIHSFSRSAAVRWVEDCCKSLDLEPHRVMIVMLGSDCFLVNVKHLKSKFEQIQESLYDVIVIDLNVDPIKVSPCNQMPDAMDALINLTKPWERYILSVASNPPHPVSFSIKVDNGPFLELGAPFLAGVLLGYPCVYYAKPEPSSEPPVEQKGESKEQQFNIGEYRQASSKLSYSMLTKITASVKLKLNTILEEFGDHFVGKQIPVIEFTYPYALMESLEDEEASQLIDAAVEKFRAVVSKRYETFDAFNDYLDLQSRITVQEEVVSTEVVSL